MSENPWAWLYEKPCHICGCGLEGLPGMKDGNQSWRHRELEFCVMALAGDSRRRMGIAREALEHYAHGPYVDTDVGHVARDALARFESSGRA